jgi:hypothetical protein
MDIPAVGVIDAFAVFRELPSHPVQPVDKLRLDLTVRHRADIQQEVPAITRRLHEQGHELRRRLVGRVGDIELPGIIDGGTSLQRQSGDFLKIKAVGILTRYVLLEQLEIFPRERRNMVVVADQALRLQPMDQVIPFKNFSSRV